MVDYDATFYEDTYNDIYLADHEHIVAEWPASTPIEADLIVDTSGISPGISSVTVLSPTSVKVNFVRPAIDNAALRSAANYSISPTLTVSEVAVEAVANPTYVVLTVSEQTTGVTYNLTLLRIEAA